MQNDFAFRNIKTPVYGYVEAVHTDVNGFASGYLIDNRNTEPWVHYLIDELFKRLRVDDHDHFWALSLREVLFDFVDDGVFHTTKVNHLGIRVKWFRCHSLTFLRPCILISCNPQKQALWCIFLTRICLLFLLSPYRRQMSTKR